MKNNEINRQINALITVSMCGLLILLLMLVGVIFKIVEIKEVVEDTKPIIVDTFIEENENVAKNTLKIDYTSDLDPFQNDIYLLIGAKYEIDGVLLKAIAIHETGNFTSNAYLTYNNPCGYMYWDSNLKQMVFKNFETVNEGINACASNLKNNYYDYGLTTPEKIQPKYAPVGINDNGTNKYWVNGVNRAYNSIIEGIGNE